MTTRIYKYTMPIQEKVTLSLPTNANIIRVDNQDGFFCLWAIVDTDNPMEDRHFMMFKTGGLIPDNVTLKYIGYATIFIQQELCLYIFEVVNED